MSNKDGKPPQGDQGFWARMRDGVLPIIRMNLTNPDIKGAIKLVGEQAKLVWQKHRGGELEILVLTVKEIEKTYATSCDIFNALLEKLHHTKPYIKSAAAPSEGDPGPVPFSEWRGRDKGVVIFSLMSAVVVLMMGAANVYANLMGSGNPVFIEQPILAYFLSALLPASSVALKFVAEIFTSDRTRRFYVQPMYALTVMAILAWTVLFAMSFHGISGGIDLDSLGETDHTASAFTGIQLLAELLVGFVLCHVAADTYSRYAPDAYIRNPEYTKIQAELKAYKEDHDRLHVERNAKRSSLVELTASRDCFINEMAALYQSMRRRFDDSSPI